MFFRALFSVPILIFFLVSPAFAQGAIETVNITAKIRTYILDAPRPEGVFIQRFEQGATKTAYGRDDSGEWLRVMDGWAVAAVMETDGDLTRLADMSRSVNFSISDGAWIYAGPSTKWFERVTELQKGSRGFAIGRNDSGSWLRVPGGWLEMEQIAKAGDTRALAVVQSDLIIVAATTRTFILAAPDIGAEFVDVFDAGAEALATEQSADGMWVKIDRGWVSRDAVSMSGSFATATPLPTATPTVTPTRVPTATPTATPPAPTATSAPTSTEPPPPAVEMPKGQAIHVVSVGETLNRIALRYGVSVQAILDSNSLENANRLIVGQELLIITATQSAVADEVLATKAEAEPAPSDDATPEAEVEANAES